MEHKDFFPLIANREKARTDHDRERFAYWRGYIDGLFEEHDITAIEFLEIENEYRRAQAFTRLAR